VRHILVKKKGLADDLYRRIKNGADFAKLASKYSQDTASAADGGKYTAYKGKSVAPFDKFVFAAKTGDLSKPVKTQFGWHIIEVLSEVKPAAPQPLAEARETIKTTLLQEQQNQELKDWVREAKANYEVTYAPGYAPKAATQTGSGTATG
jgi:foldase protein PrsA